MTEEDEFEEDDRRLQAARFRPVEHTRSQQGHVLAVMSCTGRDAFLRRTLTSLKADTWLGQRMVMMDGQGIRPGGDWWLFHPSARLDSRVGQARTFFETLRVASQFPDFSYVTMFEDDTVAAKNVCDYIATVDYPDDAAMVSWFHQLAPNPPQHGPVWMIAPAREHSCNQAITLPASIVRALLDSPQCKAWVEPHGADMLIGQVMPDAKIAYHFPNLVDHVGGAASLVGNTGVRRSPTFVGEGFDALSLTYTP